MREIKFRTYNRRSGKMVIVCQFKDGQYFQIETGHILMNNLMQFTGLLDKNGKEIYEGDIYNDDGNIGVIKFGEFDFPGIPKLDGPTVSAGFYGQDSIQASFLGDIEIIGNIHQNPELLEGLS